MDPLIVALQDAARAGFDISVMYSHGEFIVNVDPCRIITGTASDRVAPFDVRRPSLTDALGNALAIVGVEIGIDRAAKSKRLEAE